jgi:hypothetical protein
MKIFDEERKLLQTHENLTRGALGGERKYVNWGAFEKSAEREQGRDTEGG